MENAQTIAEHFNLPLRNLDDYDIKTLPISLVNRTLIRKHQVLPLVKKNNILEIAMADPTNAIALDEIRFYSGLVTKPIVVEKDKLTRMINAIFSQQQTHHKNKSDNDDAPIISFVNQILSDAINKGASDIHFEPYKSDYRIRLRIDGILHELTNPPLDLAIRVAARLKILSKLDIAERRLPQDGRFTINLDNTKSRECRISTCPMLYGEKIVVRILDSDQARLNIDELGFETQQKALFLEAIKKPQGMILVTGPTGSGKTVSLYSALRLLNTPDKNISTIEDPIEINLTGINQVNVNLKTGLTFAKTMRSFLRQDPDIMMIGEIRDLETADIAIKAAQTGHLVLSTLHTNSAAATLMRLMNIGIAPFNVASSISLIIAQRLARKLCLHCRQAKQIPKQALLAEGFDADDIEIYIPKGCKQCTKGYKGRIGLYEVMPITEPLMNLIMTNASISDISKLAINEGMQTLRKSALNKVKAGITSLEEINRVSIA